MSPQDRARMGGLMRAHVLSPGERSAIARQGAEAFHRKYGEAGLDRMRRGLPMQAVSEQTARKRRREASRQAPLRLDDYRGHSCDAA